MLLIFLPKNAKFGKKQRNDKISRFVACQITGGFSYHICIHISYKQTDKKKYKFVV